MRTSAFFQDQKRIFSETPYALEEQSHGTNKRTNLTNKETRTKTLKEFRRCLAKFDTDKINFEPILATTKNRDIGYEYF